VAKFVPQLPVVVHEQVPVTNEGAAAEPQAETERQTPKEGQRDEEAATGHGHGSSDASDGPTSSDTLRVEEPDILHVVGDIVQVRLSPFLYPLPADREIDQTICFILLAYSYKDRRHATAGVHQRLRRRGELQQNRQFLRNQRRAVHLPVQKQQLRPPRPGPFQLEQV
jgi:hypothetical protein